MDAEEIEQRAELLIGLGRYAQAAELLDRGLSTEPEHFDLLSLRAWVALQLDDFAAAQQAASSAVAVQPGVGGNAYTVLAAVHLVHGRTEEALAVARTGAELDPDAATAHMLLAICLSRNTSRRGVTQQAFAAVDRALALAPHDADMHHQAAQVAQDLGDQTAARKFVDAGLAIDPGHVELQTMKALEATYTGDRAAALTRILAANPTRGTARHALAEVVFGTIARLASGVWIFALAVILASAWISPGVLRYLAPLLMVPLIVHWMQLFGRLRKRLPPNYLSKRLWRNPAAASGVLLAGAAAVLANFAPVWFVIGFNPQTVRLGYQTLIFACLLAGLAHLLVTLGRVRRGGDVDAVTHLEDRTGNFLLWMVGLGVPIGLGWALVSFARQPGALWFALMLVPIVAAVLSAEVTLIAILRLRVSWWYRLVRVVFATVFIAGCGWLLIWCGQHSLAAEFKYREGPLSPGRIEIPTVTPLPPFELPELPSVPPR